jgi:hypothetical protein
MSPFLKCLPRTVRKATRWLWRSFLNALNTAALFCFICGKFEFDYGKK